MNAAALAKELSVTEQDVLSLGSMIYSSLKQDDMEQTLVDMSEQDRIETITAYTQAEIKKFSAFCVSLLANTEKKSAFDQYMVYKLKNA